MSNLSMRSTPAPSTLLALATLTIAGSLLAVRTATAATTPEVPPPAGPAAPAAASPLPATPAAALPVPATPTPALPVLATPTPALPVPATPAPFAPAPAASTPAAGTPASPAPPRRLAVGSRGFFQPGLLLQAWFVADHASETATTFRLRRAEISVKGEILPGRLSYLVMIDPAKVLEPQDATIRVAHQDPAASDPNNPESVTAKQPVSALSVLQDFLITYQTAWVDISIGQLKIPVSWEGYNSSARLLFPERALVARQFGDKRDLGLRLAKSFRYFGFSAGIFNGAGANNLDTNNPKDAALRLEAYPVRGLTLAGVAYMTLWNRQQKGAKDRWEADARFERGPFLFQAEYIRARDVGSGDLSVAEQGFYAAIAWTLIGVLQPCLRAGYFDPDIDRKLTPIADRSLWQYDVGLNYYLMANEAKLQLGYTRFQYAEGPANNEVILAAQVAY